MAKFKSFFIIIFLILGLGLSIKVFGDFDITKKDESKVNISPIVQLISYKTFYGNFIQSIGWGSASIINENGIIISNNHVISDENSNILDGFLVCITKELNEKPKCIYTASLIERDKEKDVSILKIDEEDIFGNKVDYKKFKTIDIDFDYEIKPQDEVLIIGYPWIGSETISQTKGIISGISEYNGLKYIKTDAVIAGGNSGGAMINSKGKLIGIPTFTVGGFFDATLGYGLYAKEFKSFVEENLKENVILEKIKKNTGVDKKDLAIYQKKIEEINEKLYLEDDFLKLKIDKDYELKNYIPGYLIQVGLKKMKEYGAEFDIISLKIPGIENEEKFMFYIKKNFYFDKKNHKIKEKIIGGIKFYEFVYKNDLSMGDSSFQKSYFGKIGDNFILININNSYSKEQEQKNKEIEKILGNIEFKKDFNGKDNNFVLKIPSVSILEKGKKAILDNILGSYKDFFGSYLNRFEISVEEKNNFSGKGKTIDEIFEAQTNGISEDYKSKITFNGNAGFVYCNEMGNSNQGYGSGLGLGSYLVEEDENGIPKEIVSCNLIIGLEKVGDKEFLLRVLLNSEKNKISENLDKLNEFLEKNLVISGPEKGKINLVNVYKNLVSLNFDDLGSQKGEYKNKLKILIKYGILENSKKFEPYKPITFGDFIENYLKIVYKAEFDKNCKNIECKLEKIKILDKVFNLNKFIKNDKVLLNNYIFISEKDDNLDKLASYIDIRLSGIEEPLSDKKIFEIKKFIKEKGFEKYNEKIEDFYINVFGQKITAIGEIYNIGDFINTKDIYLLDGKIIEKDLFDTKNLSFNPVSNKEVQKINQNYLSCIKKSKNENEKYKCFSLYKEFFDIISKVPYEIYTKANMLDYISSKIDLGLYDDKIKEAGGEK